MAFSTADILAEFVEAGGVAVEEQRAFDFGVSLDTRQDIAAYWKAHNAHRRPYLRAMKRRLWAEMKASDPARYQAALATYRERNARSRAKRRANVEGRN